MVRNLVVCLLLALPAHAAALDRNALIAEVLVRNPSIESARQAWRAALARFPQAGAFDDPMFSFEVAPLTIGTTQPVGIVAEASQKIPWPGKRDLRSAVARAEADAAASDLESVKLQMAVMASSLYDDYYAAARSLEINDEHLALIRNLQSSARAQYVVGKAAQQDMLQAEVEIGRLMQDRVTIETQIDVVKAQINELLHRAPDAELGPPVAELDSPVLPVESSAQLQEVAMHNRPAVAAAAARIRAERSAVDLAHLDSSRPDFEVMASQNTMWMDHRMQSMIGVGINLPVWKSKRDAMVAEAAAKLARAESDQAAIADRVRSEVDIAYRKAAEAHRVVQIYRDRLLPAAQDQVESSRAGFVANRNDFPAVMTAENNLRTMELDYEVALANTYRSLADLDRAIGRVPHFPASPSQIAAGESR